MNFSEIIKTAILQVVNNLRLTEVLIGKVTDEDDLKIKIDEKITLTESEIVRTGSFTGKIKQGTYILILREQGGQRYYLINTIPMLEEEEENAT